MATNASFTSRSHTLSASNPEPLLPDDENTYHAIYVKNPTGSAVSASRPTLAAKIWDAGDGFWYAIPGHLIRPRDLIGAGAASSAIDLTCSP